MPVRDLAELAYEAERYGYVLVRWDAVDRALEAGVISEDDLF